MDSEYRKNLKDGMECISIDNLVALLLESSKAVKEKSPYTYQKFLEYLQDNDPDRLFVENLQMSETIYDLQSRINHYESTITSYESAISDMQINNDELRTIIKNLREELHGVYKDRKNLQYQIAKLTH